MDNLKINTAEQTVADETAQANSPKAEAPTTAVQTTGGEAIPQGEPTEPKFQSEEERRAFQEMRLENKRLKEEIESRRTSESAFAPFRAAPQVPPTIETFKDPYTGEINWQAFNQVQSQQVAAQAAAAAEERIDEYKAREKFPDIFADPELERAVADQWFSSKMRGENRSVSQIAESLSRRFGKAVSKAEKIGAEKALEQVTPKEQASLSVSSQSAAAGRQQISHEEDSALSQAIRLGDENALAARMSKIPWANK